MLGGRLGRGAVAGLLLYSERLAQPGRGYVLWAMGYYLGYYMGYYVGYYCTWATEGR